MSSYSTWQQWTHFSIRLWWKWIWYYNWWQPPQWLDWKEAPKHFPRPNLHHKKAWSLFGGLLPVWSIIAFWILVKPLHLRSMLSKSMKCIKNRNACSQHWSTERAQFFSTTMTDHTLHNEHSKSWANWATAFCLICCIHLISHQWTTTSSSPRTTFF